MNEPLPTRRSFRIVVIALLCLVSIGLISGVAVSRLRGPRALPYEPRMPMDTSGYALLVGAVPSWLPRSSLAEISNVWKNAGVKLADRIKQQYGMFKIPDDLKTSVQVNRAMLHHSEGQVAEAYKDLEEARTFLETRDELAVKFLYTIIYYQGVTALRQGETENCIECRGESSCILPISVAARHKFETGSRLAIRHFSEYLARFPDDLEVRWLLNVAYMTLGEYPDKVDPLYLVSLEKFSKSEFDIGRFRDIGVPARVNRLNQAGGAVMDDFDNDGMLDLAVTTFDPTEPMALYHNQGDGTFEDRAEKAGVLDQLGGLYCVQTDYNNDGLLDLFIPRGAWVRSPMRPTLLKNQGNGKFADVTVEAGLLDPVNSNSACWADIDNDGWLDLFICCENQANRLYHNLKNGTFEEIGLKAGVDGTDQSFCKGATWLDYDNDGDPDLFVNFLNGYGRLYRNDGGCRFTDVTVPMGIDGPKIGFSCWAFDYDNDGWLDIFATCYDRALADVVKGLTGEPHSRNSNRLFHNLKGKGFADVTKQAGLDLVFAAMGSSFADFDNDGFLDMYLATGEPSLSTLVPNRMLKNVDGKRFSEITSSSGTGHLQKGHAVACGDWDRDGDIDLFVQTGGAVNGDKYHNVLFDNPGQKNNWLNVKLVGKQTNRAAIGARIKLVTDGDVPATLHRLVSSGSSFGANTLQQSFGLARSKRVKSLEIQWPTSGTTQVFHDIDANQAIEITEFAKEYRKLDWKPIPHAL